MLTEKLPGSVGTAFGLVHAFPAGMAAESPVLV
jgi:hypothetical protein